MQKFIYIIMTCLSLSVSSSAEIITVNWDGTGDYLTIQEGIDASVNGDIIIVKPGIYKENVNYLKKDIVLQSTEPTNPLIIEATQIVPPNKYVIGSDGIFEGFRLNGCFQFGAYREPGYSPTIRNCHIVSPGKPGIDCHVPFGEVNYPVIENNIIEAMTGVYVSTQADAYGSYPIIRNNTIIGKSLTSWGCGIQYRGDNEVGEVYNNIFMNFKWGIYFTYDSLFEQRKQYIQYNDFYGNTYNYYSQGVEFDLTGINGNISADPLFIDFENQNFDLLIDSPCIDAGMDTGLEYDYRGGIRPYDVVGIDQNGELPEYDMGAYEFIPAFETTMKLTPQNLNCSSEGNWVKAHFVLPEGFSTEDVDTEKPATIDSLTITSDHMNVSYNNEGLVEIEVAFSRTDFCSIGLFGNVELTVRGWFTDETTFYGTDTIRITTNQLEQLPEFSSHWLRTNCREPDFCNGFDIDRNGIVDLADFVLLAEN